MYSVFGGCGEVAAGLIVRTMRKADDDEVKACKADSNSGRRARMEAIRPAMSAIGGEMKGEELAVVVIVSGAATRRRWRTDPISR